MKSVSFYAFELALPLGFSFLTDIWCQKDVLYKCVNCPSRAFFYCYFCPVSNLVSSTCYRTEENLSVCSVLCVLLQEGNGVKFWWSIFKSMCCHVAVVL